MINLGRLEAVAKLCWATIFSHGHEVILPNGRVVPVWQRTDTGVYSVIINRDCPVEWEFIEQNPKQAQGRHVSQNGVIRSCGCGATVNTTSLMGITPAVLWMVCGIPTSTPGSTSFSVMRRQSRYD